MFSPKWCCVVMLLQSYSTISVEDNPALNALHRMLQSNSATHSIKTGPLTPTSAFTGFHNHAGYYVTALYRLGAGADELTSAYAQATAGMLPPAPRRGLVNSSSWEQRIGGCRCGLVSGRTDTDYLDYYDFYRASVRSDGAHGTLAKYWPRLAAGLGGDIFHAVIQLGYAFESGDVEEMTAQGLAWCSTAYAEFPAPAPASPPPLRLAPMEALSLLQNDSYPFPRYTQQDDPDGGGRCKPLSTDPHGNVCWNDAVEDLVANHSAALLRYELAWEGTDTIQQLCRAALLVFAAGGYNDFYLLHLVTGSRAVWAVANLSGVDMAALGETQRAMQTALWRTMLYAYVVKLRPDVTSPVKLSPPWRPWSLLAAGARNFTETHLAKMVFTCRDFHERWGDDLYWQVADRLVALYESGGKFRH